MGRGCSVRLATTPARFTCRGATPAGAPHLQRLPHPPQHPCAKSRVSLDVNNSQWRWLMRTHAAFSSGRHVPNQSPHQHPCQIKPQPPRGQNSTRCTPERRARLRGNSPAPGGSPCKGGYALGGEAEEGPTRGRVRGGRRLERPLPRQGYNLSVCLVVWRSGFFSDLAQ